MTTCTLSLPFICEPISYQNSTDSTSYNIRLRKNVKGTRKPFTMFTALKTSNKYTQRLWWLCPLNIAISLNDSLDRVKCGVGC